MPVLWEHLEIYLDAFHRLNLRRGSSMGDFQPIPAYEIEAYAARENVGDVPTFVRYMERLDYEWRLLAAEKAKKEST